jgi:PhnB protein
MKLFTYVNFAGRCREAFGFYEKHLGGKVTMMMTHGEVPQGNAGRPDWKDAILHARMTIGETELLGADIPNAEPMRSAYLTLIVGSTPEAERIWATLSDGGEIFMPLAETFFAFRFGQLRDKFGMNWMIIHERPRAQNA